MRTSTLCIQALSLSSLASAFYIWKPCVDGSCAHKATAAQARDNLDAREKIVTLDLVQRAHNSPRASKGRKRPTSPRVGFEKRDSNQYEIMEATTPSYSYTEGIDQDGTDLSYFVAVEVGSKKTSMYMLVDTGAGSTWLMGSTCTTDACELHNTFSASESDTFSEKSDGFNISYGSGSVTGSSVEDTLDVGGISIEMVFGLANYTSSDFESFPFDGILGLSLNAGSTDSFTEKLGESSAISNKIFSVFLARANSGTNNGELTLGGINRERYTGDIAYTSIASKTSGDWSIPLDGVSLDGGDLGVSGRIGYIDTGTSYVFGPPDDVKKLHAMIDGAESSDGSQWTVPCDTDRDLAFGFGGKSWSLDKSDWISEEHDGKCYSYIMGVEVVKGGWLLGDAFIKNVYSVFDITNRRIGFAKAKQTTSTSGSTSTSPTSGSSTVTPTASATGNSGSKNGYSASASSSSVSTATAEAQQSEATAATGTAVVSESAASGGLLPHNRLFALAMCLALAVLGM
ncbi:Aspartic-type endopeptidase ctsD [Ceratocystis platani]|uniref:Aspartic-type endopeptidase ctsD n=1 Tax=Ceratocystis fimbriata f. sp. platani TaxID=88771 RepID=A0A0F8DC80_CERFI|nr:Aspartic-type endopeptidase ctsD [Ceratocystis platani]